MIRWICVVLRDERRRRQFLTLIRLLIIFIFAFAFVLGKPYFADTLVQKIHESFYNIYNMEAVPVFRFPVTILFNINTFVSNKIQNVIQGIQTYYASIFNIRFHTIPHMKTKFKYNPFRIPSNHTLAQQHRTATSLGTPVQNSHHCACCLLPINKTPLSINFDMALIADLNPQYRSLYDYIKIASIIILLVIFDSGISQFQDAILLAESSLSFSQNSWTSLSPSYPQSKFWLYSSLSFISLTLFLLVARVVQIYRLNNILSSNLGQQCWSILLKNTPKCPNVEENIRDLFKSNFNDIQIKEIILLPEMTKYSEAKEQITRQVNNWRQLLTGEEKKKQQILVSLQNIAAANKNLSKQKEQLLMNKNENYCGNSIVVFEKRQDQQQVLRAWESKFFTKNKIEASFGGLRENETILVQPAPSPSEIDWENICLPNSFQQTKTRMNYIFLFVLQVVLFLFYFATQLCIGRKIGEKPQPNSGTVPTLLVLSMISYGLLPFLLSILQSKENNYSITKRNIEMTKKLCLSFLLIRVLVIAGVESVFVENGDLAQIALQKIVIFSFCDLIVGLSFWLINPKDLMKRIVMKFSAKKNKFTQQQLNNVYEKPSHNIPFKFSFVLVYFWTATLFSNLAPIIIIVQLIGLVSFYWVDKLNFTRRSSVNKERTSGKYVLIVHEFMQIGLILKPLANLVFWSISNKAAAIPEVIMLVVGIIYMRAPKQKFVLWILNLAKHEMKQTIYEYCQNNMDSLYRLQNPITGDLGSKVKWIEGKKGVKLELNLIDGELSNSLDGQTGVNQFQNEVCKQDLREQDGVEDIRETDRKMVGQSDDS